MNTRWWSVAATILIGLVLVVVVRMLFAPAFERFGPIVFLMLPILMVGMLLFSRVVQRGRSGS